MIADLPGDKRVRYGIFCLSLLFLSFYGIGMIDPTSWWSVHFLAFLPGVWAYMLLAIGITLMAVPLFLKLDGITSNSNKGSKWFWMGVIVVGSIGFGVMCHQFPIVLDNYGDAPFVRPEMGKVVEVMPPHMAQELQTITILPDHCRLFMLSMVNISSYLTGATIKKVYVWMDLLSGVAWFLTWLLWVRSRFSNGHWILMMSLLGITAPFLGAFFGHLEMYAPMYVLLLWWGIALINAFETKRWGMIILTALLILIFARMHPFAWLLWPAWLLVLLSKLELGATFSKRWLSWKGVGIFVGLPVLVGGLITYFFITKDHVDNRVLSETIAYDHLFLPLFSPDPPYDHYNLFSWAHFFDYFNSLLFNAASAWFVLIALIVFYRKQLDGHQLTVIALGTSLLSYWALLFVMNPIMTMPMDWDLYALTIPLLLLLIGVLAHQLPAQPAPRLLWPVMALALFNLPFVFINHQTDAYAARLERIGVHVFKTYYDWSSKQLSFALQLRKDDPANQKKRQEAIIKELQPYALKGNDLLFADLVSFHGKSIEPQDLVQAKQWYELAYGYAPQHQMNLLRLLEVHFKLGEYGAAYEDGMGLIELSYPTKQKAMRMTIHCAAEADKREALQQLVKDYLMEWPEDQTIQTLHERLDAGAPKTALTSLFAR